MSASKSFYPATPSSRKGLHEGSQSRSFERDTEEVENTGDSTDTDDNSYSVNDSSREFTRESNISRPQYDEGVKGLSSNSILSKTNSSSGSQSISIRLLTVSLALVIALVIGLFVGKGINTNIEKLCSYEDLIKTYPEQQNQDWLLHLSVCVQNILNGRSDKPCIFLFLHQGGERTRSLVQDIATKSSECFGGQQQLVKMQENLFTAKETIRDYGIAIEEFKNKVKQGNVVLVANLNAIPAETAKALHTICDIYSPLAKDVVIILTVEAPETNGNPTERATNVLLELWGDQLMSNELQPLITRVTDQVIALIS